MERSKILKMKEIPAEAVANNEDLLTQILLRLPIKPLLKAKCVSKQWLSLVSNPKFCLSHTRHHHTTHLKPTAIFLHQHFPPTPQIQIVPLKHDHTVCNVPFLDSLNDPRVKIQKSCNGLVIYSIFSQKRRYKYFICNPSTRQFKQLTFPSEAFKDTVYALNLAFDPLKSPYYKVISIRQVSGSKYQFIIDTYSSETDSWTLLGITLRRPDGMGFHDAVFCNGAIHWSNDDVNSLYFDVDNECLKTMPMPKLKERSICRKFRYFGESGGHLHLVVTYLREHLSSDPNAWKFDVLEMAEDYSQWIVRYHVDLNAMRSAMSELIPYRAASYYEFCVFDVIRAEKEEESMVLLLVDGRVFSYNPYNGISKKLCDLEPKPETWDLAFCSHQFFETLCGV